MECGNTVDALPGGVPTDTSILTQAGWQQADDVAVGTPLVHPNGEPSTFLGWDAVGERDLARVTLADGSTVDMAWDQPLHVRLEAGSPARVLTPTQIADMVGRGRAVRFLRHEPYQFGTTTDLPLDPWLLGVLLGDGYLRKSSVQLCNQREDVQDLVRQTLPDGARLGTVKVGAAGTGSAYIVGSVRGRNPVVVAARALGLDGKRAWEKFIPEQYIHAALGDRLSLLRGLLDTDGSIDKLGRIEYSTSSPQLCQDLLQLVMSVGGRASYRLKENVRFTAPRQSTPKAARDAHRLLNIRLPEAVEPFRTEAKRSRMQYGRAARHWTVQDVTAVGAGAVGTIRVSAADGQWIGSGYSTFVSEVSGAVDGLAA